MNPMLFLQHLVGRHFHYRGETERERAVHDTVDRARNANQRAQVALAQYEMRMIREWRKQGHHE